MVTQVHGTLAGYSAHYKHGTKVCRSCQDALNDYRRERRQLGEERRQRISHVRGQLEDACYTFGACRSADPRLFHSDDHDDIQQALDYCADCPVVTECQMLRRLHDGVGVWGGERWYPGSNEPVRDKRWAA